MRVQMRVVSCVVFAFVWAGGTASVSWAQKPATPHVEFVMEYIRELAATETIRDSATRELEEAGVDNSPSSSIHIYTLFKLELQSEIGVLKAMRLNPPYDVIIPDVTRLYELKIVAYER